MSDPVTIVRASDTAGLLAMMPSLAGRPLRNSVAIAPFIGTLTLGVLRVDLPEQRSAITYRQLASVLLGHLSRIPSCERVAVVIYSDERLRKARPAWDELEQHLLQSFRSAGFSVIDTVCVAADAWAAFDETALTGHPLSLIAESSAQFPRDHDVTEPILLPDTDPELAARVATMLADRLEFGEERSGLGVYRPASAAEPVAALERLLSTADPVPAASISALVGVIQTQADVDRTILQIAFGETVGATAWDRALELRRLAAAVGETPFDYVIRESDSGRRDVRDERAMRMIGGDSTTAPSPERIRRGIQLLGHVVAHTPRRDGIWALCALAWLHWALGHGALAGDLLDRAGDIDPRHEMTQVLRVLFSASLPEWIYRRAVPNRAERRRAARRGAR